MNVSNGYQYYANDLGSLARFDPKDPSRTVEVLNRRTKAWETVEDARFAEKLDSDFHSISPQDASSLENKQP